MDISDKVTHVKAAKQTRLHHCHWPNCKTQVPPAMWGCKVHWFMLPLSIRRAIWQSYRIGQEEDLRVSARYLTAAHQAQKWIHLYLEKLSTKPSRRK